MRHRKEQCFGTKMEKGQVEAEEKGSQSAPEIQSRASFSASSRRVWKWGATLPSLMPTLSLPPRF
jgi:hypothetical protein